MTDLLFFIIAMCPSVGLEQSKCIQTYEQCFERVIKQTPHPEEICTNILKDMVLKKRKR